MKTNVGLLSVTVFFCLYFSAPKVQAYWPNTNYYNQFSKSVPVDKANIVPTPDERVQPAEHKDFIPALIFFVIVLAAFAYIIYQLIKLMDKIIPPPEKKPDPPPHSANTNITIVMNPTHGPGPALTETKTLKIDSNTPSWGPVQCYDIAALNYENDCEKFPTRVNYDSFWSVGMMTTTNLVDWEDSHYRIDCYVCSFAGAVCYAYFHYGTNFWNCYYTSDYVKTNHMAPAWFNLSDGPPKPNQFFRLDPR